MSKKTTTTSNQNTGFQFDPNSLSAYQNNVRAFLPTAQSWYQNPYGNSLFQQEAAIGQEQAGQVGQTQKSNILANANALGYSTDGGITNALLQRAGRNTAGLQAGAFRSAILNANQRATTGLGISSGFQPLLTGSNTSGTSTQSVSGLGTWLPQVAGIGLGAALAPFTGGASLAGSLSSAASLGASGTGDTGAGASGFAGGISNFGSAFSGRGYGYGSSGGANPFPNNPFYLGGTPPTF